MLATANGLKESLGEYWTDGLVILWLKPRSGTRRFNQRPPSTSVREIISSNGGFNLRFYIPEIPGIPQRPGTPSDWSDPPAHGPSGGTKHPVGGGILPPTGLPAEQNLQPMEESSRRQSFRRPKTSNGRRKHPCAGIRKGVPGASRPGIPRKPKDKKGGSRSVTLDGNPDVECGGVLLSHTLSSAVPSPRPGLSFRVRKGTGRLTWAMTTAKPIQRPTTRIGRQNRNHATRPIPIVAVREPDNGREQPNASPVSSS